MNEKKPDDIGIEKHFSPAQIAEALELSVRTVCRMLENEEGIVRLGRRGLEQTRITMRVPKSRWEIIHEKWIRVGMDSPGRRPRKRRKKGQEGPDNGGQK